MCCPGVTYLYVVHLSSGANFTQNSFLRKMDRYMQKKRNQTTFLHENKLPVD